MFGYDPQHTRYNPSENVLNPTNVSGLVVDWTATTGNPYFNQSSPAVANGVVYICSSDGELHAFNASTGATIWTVNIGLGATTSPAVANGVVYVGLPDSHVYAFNASTGVTIWTAIWDRVLLPR